MVNMSEVLETNQMISAESLDVRTITMGISLLDCIDSDLGVLKTRIYGKILRYAGNLVDVGEHISREFGIPIVNKRVSVTPIALIGAAACHSPEDFVELALLSDGKSGNFEVHSVLNSLEKLAEADLPGLFPGKWMIADLNGKSALTSKKAVYDFVSSEKAYMNASYQPRTELGTQWIDRMELSVAVSDGKITLTNTPDAHTKVVEEYTVTAVSADEFTADRRLTITVDGAATLDEEMPVRLVRVKDDYSAAVLGTWQGVKTSEQAAYGNIEAHHWEFKSDGTYVFSMKNPDGDWIPTEDVYSDYFVAGNLLCTRWKNAGEGKEETREWWEIDSIEDGVMRWSALCLDADGNTYTATFEMRKAA